MLSVSCAVAVLVLTSCQAGLPIDRSDAERLARDGKPREALHAFEQIVARDPSDLDARLWTARLALRLGRADEAEAQFRYVIERQPANVDARIGLGATLTRKGNWSEALRVLLDVQRDAGENADLFAALARAYRRAGDDRRALEYFQRARMLNPKDPDIVSGFEDAAQAYGHALAFEGFSELVPDGSGTDSGSLVLSLRVHPRVHVQGAARLQQRADQSDVTAGGGVRWRAGRGTTVAFRAVGGSGNTILPNADLAADVAQYAGYAEVGGGIRSLSFADANVIAASLVGAWDPGRWRLDSRYTSSRTSFDSTGESSGDHSALVRGTWRAWRRVAVSTGAAYGIESFEDLSADRLGSLGATTLSLGARIEMPSLTALSTIWEHQWRSNDTTIDRLTVVLVQGIP
jgi:Tfp pilus assembly protein PilF